LAAVQRSVQIGRHAQQYETSDVIARRYMGMDHQPLAAQCSHRRGLNRSVRSQRRKVMKTASLLSMALVAGLSVATWTSQATAAVKNAAAGRDGAMTRCLLEAKTHYPGSYRDWDSAQHFSYQSCMHDAGYVE
jgi:hypothetical protein